MFKVYCRSKAHKQWKPYSQPFIELDNAEKCKAKCESMKKCDIHGNLIQYKVMEEKGELNYGKKENSSKVKYIFRKKVSSNSSKLGRDFLKSSV